MTVGRGAGVAILLAVGVLGAIASTTWHGRMVAFAAADRASIGGADVLIGAVLELARHALAFAIAGVSQRASVVIGACRAGLDVAHITVASLLVARLGGASVAVGTDLGGPSLALASTAAVPGCAGVAVGADGGRAQRLVHTSPCRRIARIGRAQVLVVTALGLAKALAAAPLALRL